MLQYVTNLGISSTKHAHTTMTYVADVNEKSTPVDCICHTSFQKSPRKPRSHAVQSEYMIASQNLCETASRTPAIAHTYLYTVIFKMKEKCRQTPCERPTGKTNFSLILQECKADTWTRLQDEIRKVKFKSPLQSLS